MAQLDESAQWEDFIYRLETTDPVVGGDSGVSNIQANQLANRTAYLKQSVEAAQAAAENAQTAADIAIEAAATAQETADLKVAKTGDTMTGNLTIPAGTDPGHAVNKAQLDGLQTVPTGAVMAFARQTPPSGWLECDGALVSRTTYNALFTAIGIAFGAGDGVNTFKLPDLRGEFPRGWDHGRGVDPGRTFGSAQLDDFKSHTHSYNVSIADTNGFALGELTHGEVGVPANTGATGGTETRPRNVALLYCIKV
jgi:microcystin-dependent protein